MKQKTVLITGSEGFTGRYLESYLSEKGYIVIGIDRNKKGIKENRNLFNGVTDTKTIDLFLSGGDLSNRRFAMAALALAKPTYIIHLAGATTILENDKSAYIQSNIQATENILEMADLYKRTGQELKKIILVSSAQVYGNTPEPIAFESTPFSPRNIYGISKCAVEMLGNYWRQKGLPIVTTRPFNYTGRGQSENFLIPKLVKAFRGRDAEITVDNLDTVRDYMDVRDVVRIYSDILEPRRHEPTVMNVCSGKGYSVSEILSLLYDLTGHNGVIKVSSFRREEVKSLVGSTHTMKQFYDIDKHSFIPLVQTLKWMLEE